MEKLSTIGFKAKGKKKRARGESSSGVSMADLEALIRRLIREEVPFLLKQILELIPTQTHNHIEIASSSGTRNLELRFIGKFPKSIFTLNKLVAESETHVRGKKRKPKSEKDDAIQVALYDTRSGSIVNDGPFCSIKVMLCVLSGDFGSKGKDDWSPKDFNDSVLHEREGKAPLIKGHLFIDLKEGGAEMGDVSFSDNSSWTGTKKFKLGAKAVQSEENIREAISEPFRVKDLRGESYEKHYPASLSDEIWRLKMISKNGKLHEQLCRLKIETVGDLLLLVETENPYTLFKNLKGISKKKWDAIIQHAQTAFTDSPPLTQKVIRFHSQNYEDNEKYPSHNSLPYPIPDASYITAASPSLQAWCNDPRDSQEFDCAAASQENRELLHFVSDPSASPSCPQGGLHGSQVQVFVTESMTEFADLLMKSNPTQEHVELGQLSPAIYNEETWWRNLDDIFGADFGMASTCSCTDFHNHTSKAESPKTRLYGVIMSIVFIRRACRNRRTDSTLQFNRD